MSFQEYERVVQGAERQRRELMDELESLRELYDYYRTEISKQQARLEALDGQIEKAKKELEENIKHLEGR